MIKNSDRRNEIKLLKRIQKRSKQANFAHETRQEDIKWGIHHFSVCKPKDNICLQTCNNKNGILTTWRYVPARKGILKVRVWLGTYPKHAINLNEQIHVTKWCFFHFPEKKRRSTNTQKNQRNEKKPSIGSQNMVWIFVFLSFTVLFHLTCNSGV